MLDRNQGRLLRELYLSYIEGGDDAMTVALDLFQEMGLDGSVDLSGLTLAFRSARLGAAAMPPEVRQRWLRAMRGTNDGSTNWWGSHPTSWEQVLAAVGQLIADGAQSAFS